MVYISHLLVDDEMKALLDTHEELGVESIEFSIGYCLDDFDNHIEDYRKRLEKMDCPQLSIHGPFLDLNPASNDSYIREVTRKRFQEAYEAAKILQADKVIYHSGLLERVHFQQGWVELAVPFWEKFLEDKDDSISIYMENVFDPQYELLGEVCDKVNHPAFSLCLDLGHANHASEDTVVKWIEGLQGRIGHIHIHDNDGIHDQHLAIGTGTIDWESTFKAMKAYIPEVDVTIENSQKEAVEKSLAYLQNHHIFP